MARKASISCWTVPGKSLAWASVQFPAARQILRAIHDAGAAAGVDPQQRRQMFRIDLALGKPDRMLGGNRRSVLSGNRSCINSRKD
jgi:hypothetical protein